MYKQDTVFQIFYFVKKKKVEPCYCLHMCFISIRFNQILLSVENIFYEHIELVHFVQKTFCEKNGNYILYFMCKQS